MPSATFTADRAYRGLDTVLAWIEFAGFNVSTGAAVTYRWSALPVAHSAFELDGRTISLGRYSRAFSDTQGQYQGAGFSFTISDYDQVFRSFLESVYQQYIVNTECVVKICTAADLKAGNTPIIWGRGRVTDYEFLPVKQARITCEDEFSPSLRVTIPRRLVDSPRWTQNLGLPEPILYGKLEVESASHEPGAVQAFWVGDVQVDNTGSGLIETWGIFLLAGHAVAQIQHLYHDYAGGAGYSLDGRRVNRDADLNGGAQFVYAPKRAHWTGSVATFVVGGGLVTANPYSDFIGTDGVTRRYTVIYVRYQVGLVPGVGIDAFGAACRNGSVELWFDVWGTEPNGDASGAVIEDQVAQFKHFMTNYGLPGASLPNGYMTGAYAAPGYPTWADGTPKVKDAAFDAANLGYTGAVVLNEADLSLRDALAQFAVSMDADFGFNREQQLIASILTATAIAAYIATETDDILDRTFQIQERVSQGFANVMPVEYQAQYGAGSSDYLGNIEAVDDGSIADYYDKRVVAQSTRLAHVRTSATATAIALRRLARATPPPRIVSFATGLHALTWELGDVIAITHREGTGPTGWMLRTVRIERITLDADAMLVLIEGRDLQMTEIAIEEAMAIRGLIGSRTVGVTDDDADGIIVFDRSLESELTGRIVMLDHDTVPTGYIVKVRWWGRIEGAARYTPQVWNAVTAAEVVAGAQVSSTSFPAANAPAELTIPTTTGVKYYLMRGKAVVSSPAGGDACYADIRVDVEAP